MARRNDHTREQLKQLMLDAAQKIVVSEGEHGLSTRKITERVGYTVGTLYLVFDDLDDLIVQLNGRTLDELYKVMQRSQHAAKPRESIRLMAAAYCRYVTRNEARWRLCIEHKSTTDKPLPGWIVDKGERLLALIDKSLVVFVADKKRRMHAVLSLCSSVHGACMLYPAGQFAPGNQPALKRIVTDNVEQLIQSWKHSQ